MVACGVALAPGFTRIEIPSAFCVAPPPRDRERELCRRLGHHQAPAVAGRRCVDLSSEGEMRLEEPMAGADAAEPEAEATTGLGLGADAAVAATAPEQTASVQTASSVPPQLQQRVLKEHFQ